ncbi:unnamed protein product, partial [Rotaria magnacalcarata]
VSTPHTQLNSSTINESFENGQSYHHNITEGRHHVDSMTQQIPPRGYTPQTTHTIVIPPSAAIPTFNGNISENPRHFLIRAKEYAETINHWNDQALLNGISQLLRETALEWYCQLRTSNRRPQTWTEFIGIFLNQFNSPMRRARQEQQWKNCKQEENETINEFIVRLRALWQEQKPNENEDDLIRHLMCKMRNNVLTMIGISRCGSLDEIIIEAQKVEEILYQRNKQLHRNSNQDRPQNNTSTTSIYNNDNPYEIQAVSAYQKNRQMKTYAAGNYTNKYYGNDHQSSQWGNYSSYPTTNRRDTYSTYETRCYACGKKGHNRNNCPQQYNTYSQQQSWYYPKNDDGAQDGRDHGAPN